MIQVSNPYSDYIRHKSEILEAINRVLENGRYILGDEVKFFENEFAAYVGTKYAVGVGSGTEALHLALKAIGIKRGDEVITVSHTAVATVSAIVMSGARPVFVDIDPLTYLIDVNRIKISITRKTKAIIPVHLYGNACNMNDINELAKDHGLFIIEDCCQAHGTLFENRHVGAFGNIGVFSFYPTKNLGAIGDGGAIVTDDSQLDIKIRELREYGWRERYVSYIHGWNSRLDEIQAAILRVKLKHLSYDINSRRSIALKYDDMIRNEKVKLPYVENRVFHSYHLYVIRCINRSALIQKLKSKGINTLIHYPVPVHLQPGYSKYWRGEKLEETEKIAQELISLPMYPGLEAHELYAIIETINNF